MRIAFAAGGTGGHVYPALAVASEVVRRLPGTEVLFIGGTRGIERKIVSGSGYPVETIPACGMPRKLSPSMAVFLWKLTVSVLRSRAVLSRFRPSVVVATGGYVSGPPILAARSLGIPSVIQEQNSLPGIVNRTFARFADTVFLGFENARHHFPESVETVFTGNPVREEIGAGDRGKAADAFGLDPARKTLLVFGGSQGSRAINQAIAGTIEKIAAQGIQVLWQTGEGEFERWSGHDRGSGGLVRVLPYIPVMADAYALADLALARAGAISIAEMTVCGLPGIFVPLPTAAENHQEHNARSLEQAGAAAVIPERELTPALLGKTALDILGSDTRLRSMSEASKRLGRTDAAARIADKILERYGAHA